MNHRFLLRLVTNLAIFLLTVSCFGVVLWVIDEFLLWDILPDAWSLIVRALLVAGGVIAFVLVIMNVLLSLALVAESNASRADLPNYGVSQRVKRRVRQSIVVGIVAIALLIGGLQVTDHLRAQVAVKEERAKFVQAQAKMDSSIEQTLKLFTPPLLEAIETHTLAEKGQLGNMAKLFRSIQSSFPNSPSTALLMPATEPPFKYMRVDSQSIQSNGSGKTILSPKLYATFPTKIETQAVEQLLTGKLPSIKEPLTGQLINNTLPSSWGVLKRKGKIIAIAYLQSDQLFSALGPNSSLSYHDGPNNLLSN